MVAIDVRELRKSYGEVIAVDGVSFSVAEGETFGILGPNGAGKTTTLEMIEGLTRPDGGEVDVLGSAVWPDPRPVQLRIGVQLQSTSLFEGLTVRELLVLYARLYGQPDDGRTERVLAIVGLDEKAGSKARELSGGQQQRLAIALALVHDPELVFLDEPTTGLDPQARRALWEVIRSIAEQGRTVVLTTHYLEEAEELCERVAIMDGGRIVALDTPRELVRALGAQARIVVDTPPVEAAALAGLPGVTRITDSPGSVELATGEPQVTLAALLDLATRRGFELTGLSVVRPSLEDVFLELTGRGLRE